MIQLMVWMHEDVVRWSLVKFRPAHLWRSLGSRYWERSGEVTTAGDIYSDRQLLTAALKAIQDKLGEREDLGVTGQ